jgi:hypothetical protein
MKKSNQEPAKLNAEQLLAYIAGCKGNISGQRLGQALFNNLYRMHPELADSIRGTEVDPFHNNNKIADFFEAITTPEGYVNVPKNFKK